MRSLYTKQEILQKCEEAFQNIPAFYRADMLNYSSHLKELNLPCTEVIAEFLCERITAFTSGFSVIRRESSYRTESHDGKIKAGSPLSEEVIAKQLFRQSKFEYIGEVLDYQIPLRNSQADSAGNIDLLSVNHPSQTVFILELKKPDNQKDSMLRCVLEAYTYLQTVDQKKLLKDFGLPEYYLIQASPLVFYGDSRWKELQNNRPALKKLMHLLNCKPYYLLCENGKYIVHP